MMIRMGWPSLNYLRLLRYTGMFTLSCAAAPLWVAFGLNGLAGRGGKGALSDLIGWLVCQLLFAAVYLALTGRWRSGPRWAAALGLAVMTVTALGVGWFSHSGVSALLLVVVAMVLPWLLPWPLALAWMLGQHLLLVPVLVGEFHIDSLGLSIAAALLQAFTYLGISTLSFIVSMIARQQVEAREALRALNAELRATRALLAESSRLAERMRIARELHDLVGHHLTALSLNLEVASHLGAGKAELQVKAAQRTAKRLLADVRAVVSELRQDDAIELGQALRSLGGDVPGLRIHMDLPARLEVADPQRAQGLLRCAQEIVTNTARHAQARHLWLQCRYLDADTLLLAARDDGRGAATVTPGHGICGMRERLAAFEGRLEIETATGQGFRLRLYLPLGESELLAHAPGRGVPAAWDSVAAWPAPSSVE